MIIQANIKIVRYRWMEKNFVISIWLNRNLIWMCRADVSIDNLNRAIIAKYIEINFH